MSSLLIVSETVLFLASTFFVGSPPGPSAGGAQEPILVPLMPTHLKGSKIGPRIRSFAAGCLFEPISLTDLPYKMPVSGLASPFRTDLVLVERNFHRSSGLLQTPEENQNSTNST